jgi:pyruvate decarboxylase/indolepyruvate decarboxylase
MKITIADYLLRRLKEFNIKHIFGVPGDYNLFLLDYIENDPDIAWVGTCNELNGAYAADGYARMNGMSAMVTTFGVGELSAINGIAGAYAEFVPVVHIVGAPSTYLQNQHALVHHNFLSDSYSYFSKIYEQVSCAQATLTEENATTEIDRVLTTCWNRKLPVYINIPANLVSVKVDAPQKPLTLTTPIVDNNNLIQMAEHVTQLLKKAKQPVIIIDACVTRYPNVKADLLKFIEKTGIPFASAFMGKSYLSEQHPQFIGVYTGVSSNADVKNYVETSDCAILFGGFPTDFNTGGYTTKIDANLAIEAHSHYVRVGHAFYQQLPFDATLKILLDKVAVKFDKSYQAPHNIQQYKANSANLSQKRFWERMETFLQPNDIVIGEVGSSAIALGNVRFPDNATFISQMSWASIGYTVGATLGTLLANPKRRTVLFVGDGSFQLTAQEVSTMIRHHLAPVIFLINNDGYTVERIIHGENMHYNDIQPWKYAQLPAVFGDNVWTVKVTNEVELEHALAEAAKHTDKLCFIEAVFPRMDFMATDMLKKSEQLNKQAV